MTNVQSMFGAGLWALVATLLLLATFEPVEQGGPALAKAEAAEQSAAA
jgi:hypothetical protein